MDDDIYSLENMVKTFAEHDKRAQKDQKRLNQKRDEQNPNWRNEIDEDSQWILDPFSLPKALQTICEEIEKIKRKLCLK